MGTALYDGMSIHRVMVRDRVRNEVYRRALARYVEPGTVVLDVGAGSGILSLLAAQAGAGAVFAVERAQVAAIAEELVAQNGATAVEVVAGDITQCELPSRVDVLVSEWLGVYGVDENLLAPVLAARDRWLKPGGRILPGRVVVWMAPVFSESYHDETEFFESRPYDLDLSPLAAHHSADQLHWSREGLGCDELLADPRAMWVIDLHSFPAHHARLPFRAAIDFTVIRPARVNGLAAWFSAEFGPGLVLSNAPGAPATHWGHYVFPLTRSVAVESGTPIEVRFACLPAGPGFCHHAWKARVGDGAWESHDTRRSGGPVWNELPPRPSPPDTQGDTTVADRAVSASSVKRRPTATA